MPAGPGTKGPGRGKGKGSGKGDGKGDKNKDKNKNKNTAPLPPLPANTLEAAKTPPAKRTAAQKKLLACKFYISGQCSAGAQCEYSHDKTIW